MSYLDDLSHELGAAGVTGARRRRILDEIGDHLSCDPQAELGPPADLAREWADQLGTGRARRAGLGAFVALAGAGVLFTGVFLTSQAEGLRVSRWGTPGDPLGSVGFGLIAIGAQVAFVAGLASLLRIFRLRRDPVIARSEATFVGRQALVALVAGFACLVGLVIIALRFGPHLPSWWRPLALVAAGLGICFLAAAVPTVIGAVRIRPLRAGRAGDLFDDLGPLVPAPLRGRPWILAAIIALGVAAAITFAGVIQDDPYDGLLRGLVDAGACLIGFALLGTYLGLRQSPAE